MGVILSLLRTWLCPVVLTELNNMEWSKTRLFFSSSRGEEGTDREGMTSGFLSHHNRPQSCVVLGGGEDHELSKNRNKSFTVEDSHV